jgi:hypothetical protein
MIIIGATLAILFVFGAFAQQCAGYSLGEGDKRSATVYAVIGAFLQIAAITDALILW